MKKARTRRKPLRTTLSTTVVGSLPNNATGLAPNQLFFSGAPPTWMALGLLVTDTTSAIINQGTSVTAISTVTDTDGTVDGFLVTCSAPFSNAAGLGDNINFYTVDTVPELPSVDETSLAKQANAVWPDLANQNATIAPPRNGMDRSTGQLLQGWDHVEQSMEVIFATPFHQRVLRRWVGSFVPAILGDNIVQRVIMRFFWAIASALDLWEPDYRIKQVYFMGNALSGYNPAINNIDDLIRVGHVYFRQEGVYYPRGHLGNFTPYEQRQADLVGAGGKLWDVIPVSGS